MSENQIADPLLTANVYCQGHRDGALREVVGPLLQEARGSDPEAYAWTVRYGRRGQHLKIRLHGSQLEAPALRHTLTALAEEFFRGLDEPPPERAEGRGPAIDPEDQPEGLEPDRTVVWTTYRRSHVSLGGDPFLSRDGYAARMTECLGRGCELVLGALEQVPEGELPSSVRQKLLLKALLSGLPAAGFGGAETAAAYLRYHRDWLLRFFLADEAEERRALERLDRQLERMAATVSQLRKIGLGEAAAADDGADPWPASLSRLAAYLEEYREDPDFQTDPFAPDAAHPGFFKVFHGTANQAGLGPLEEAFVHHLLIAALAGGEGAGQSSPETVGGGVA